MPEKIHATYTKEQQKWLYSVEGFLNEVKERQNICGWVPGI